MTDLLRLSRAAKMRARKFLWGIPLIVWVYSFGFIERYILDPLGRSLWFWPIFITCVPITLSLICLTVEKSGVAKDE